MGILAYAEIFQLHAFDFIFNLVKTQRFFATFFCEAASGLTHPAACLSLLPVGELVAD